MQRQSLWFIYMKIQYCYEELENALKNLKSIEVESHTSSIILNPSSDFAVKNRI